VKGKRQGEGQGYIILNFILNSLSLSKDLSTQRMGTISKIPRFRDGDHFRATDMDPITPHFKINLSIYLKVYYVII
jgi:hypothetical protein